MPFIPLNSQEVQHLCERDWRLAHLIEHIGPLEYHRPESAFHSLAHSIIEQMLSMKSAATIEGRVQALCGGTITPLTIIEASINELRSCGISGRKASNLQALAEYALEHDLEALTELSDTDIRNELLAMPGIGKWTCDMFLLFYLEREDILPIGDGAFRQAFQWLYGVPVENEGVRQVICDLWKPYSSTAARYLYRAINTGLTRSISSKILLQP